MPTPVSALIHAATMVTAGVYLLIRTSPLIEYSSTVLILCLWIGAITTVFSSLIGLFQQDIKKVIAYSTMSQLAREYLFRNQTICVEVIYIYRIYNIYMSKINNSQITKAHDYLYNHISNNFFNSFLKWKVIIIGKLVGISEAIRLILINIKIILNQINLIYKSFISFILTNIYNLGIFYTLRPAKLADKANFINLYKNIHDLSNNNNSNISYINISDNNYLNNHNKSLLKFNEWLAGLIDGDGYFILTKKGYASLEITMNISDKSALYEVKHKYGGSIKPVAGAKALRYKLRHKKGLIELIKGVNGLIRNPARILQLNKLCIKYDLKLKEPLPLTYNNGWFSGFIDSDGSIYFNEKSGQLFISLTQKNRFLLEPLLNLYGGKIYIMSPKIEAFKYVLYRKKEILNLIDDYFKKYALKSSKSYRINLIKEFYELKNYKDINSNMIDKYNKSILFKNKWEKYKN